jgi:hypothetical protein
MGMLAGAVRARVGAAVFAAIAGSVTGCGASDDDAGGGADASVGGTTGGGGMPAGGAGGSGWTPTGEVHTQFWTKFEMTRPEGANEVLGPLFNAALQDRSIKMLLQRDETKADGPIVRIGSADLVAGQDTEMDPTDDVFAFRTEATCSDAAGADIPCEMAIGEIGAIEAATGYTSATPTVIEAYSSTYKMVIRMREVDLEVGLAALGADCDFDVCASFVGAVTVSDASRTVFELTTGQPDTRTDLKTFMENFGVAPDTEVLNLAGEMEAAYTFAGTFAADEVAFQAD